MSQKSSWSGCIIAVILLVMFACVAGAVGIAVLFLTGNADVSLRRTDGLATPRARATLAPPVHTPASVPVNGYATPTSDTNAGGWDTALVDGFSFQTWRTFDMGGSYGNYQNEQYHFHVEGAQKLLWVTSGNVYADDVIVEADIMPTMTTSPGNNYGLVCRFTDNNNFYFLVYNNEGSAGIGKIKNGNVVTLQPFSMTFPALSPHSTHRVRAECVGSRLSLYIDGQEVVTGYDADFIAGDIGLIAGTLDNPPVDVLFDNLVVRTR